MNVFVDANVIIDFLDSSRRGHDAAAAALATLVDEGCTPVVSEDLLTTIYYVVRDKGRVLDFFSYILETWLVVPFGPSILEKTVEDCRRDGSRDFEDRAQGYAALQAGCRHVLTRDEGFSAPHRGRGLTCVGVNLIREGWG